MLPFVLILLVAGIGLVIAGRRLEQQARLSMTWPTVAGVLEQCEVVEVPGLCVEDLGSWQLRILYSYVVRGSTYRSNQYAFGYGDGRDDKPHRAVAAMLRAQSELVVHYNPKRPSEAVLSTQAQTNVSTVGYSTLVVAAIAALIWLLR